MKPVPSSQKLRGGYYTPGPVADFLTRWAITSPRSRVLEPSCGDGVLIESAVRTLKRMGAEDTSISELIHGVEVDAEEAEKARTRVVSAGIPTGFQLHVGDFFAYCRDDLLNTWLKNPFSTNGVDKAKLFDAVVGNPPFVRYQSFLESHRAVAFQLMQRAGLHPNRLTNSWVPFLVASTFLLTKTGRLAMVIPAELFQVNYASEIRQFLSNYYKRITIVTFEKLVFAEILQEVVLLLAERDSVSGENEGIRVVELSDVDALCLFNLESLTSIELKPMDHSTEKWTQYFLTKDEILLLRQMREDHRLTTSGEVINVDVGVVTGENSFFVLNEAQARTLGVEPSTTPIVTRTSHLQGLAFTTNDLHANGEKGYPTRLLKLPDVPVERLPSAVRDYLKTGELRGIPKQYKCSIRKNWYVAPSIWTPDAFMLRQVHLYPRIVINETKATSTDTIHRVRFSEGINGKQVTAAFINSLTLAFSEVTGRSYGGGVLTFEPSECERLPLPLVGAAELDFDHLNKLLREGKIEQALDMNDAVLLERALGLSSSQARTLRNIWDKLRNRRVKRT